MGALALGIEDCLLRVLRVDEVAALSPESRLGAVVIEGAGNADGGFLDVLVSPTSWHSVSP